MRLALASLLLLTACASTGDAAPGAEELEAAAGARALAFARASAEDDWSALRDLVASEAVPYIEARMGWSEFILDEPPVLEVGVLELVGVVVEGQVAIATICVSTGGSESFTSTARLLLESGEWGVASVAMDDGAGSVVEVVLRDRTSEAEATLTRAREQSTPHPELAAPVERYLAAAADGDESRMAAVMTVACAAAATDGTGTPGADLLAGRLRVAKWHFLGRGEIVGDAAEQLVLGRLLRAGREPHVEPLIFHLERADDAWRVASLELR